MTAAATPTASGLARRDALVSAVGTAVVWEIAARLVDQPVLPPFSDVVLALAVLLREGRIFGDIAASLSALAAGFGLAIAVGIGVGVLMGTSRAAEVALEPYLNAGLAAPAMAFVPILFTLGGTSRWTQVGTVFLYSVFVIASYTLAGVHGANRTLVEMARAFGATRRQTLALVVLPGARATLVSGLRVAVAMAVKGMINGEMLIASTGLGALVRTHGSRFEADKVMALMLVIVTIAMAATGLLRRVERRLLDEAVQS